MKLINLHAPSSSMSPPDSYTEASIKTADNLRSVAQSVAVRELSQLSLPEIEAVVNTVSQVVPAGNVPGIILNGLARLTGRRPPAHTVRRDINLLFKGVETALDKAVYRAMFAGPAAVLWGYQNLLKLAGKESEHSFPDGVWQFYVEYAMREDSARHTCETQGFDRLLQQHQIRLSPVDRLTAWVMAAIHCLHQYHDLLANEWRERTATHLLDQMKAEQPGSAGLYAQWRKQRPTGRGSDAAPNQDYPAYRRQKFDQFLAEALRHLSATQQSAWEQQLQAAERDDLPAYQQQLSILAYLEPGAYGETRVPIPLAQAHVGLIHQGRYYLIPACAPGTADPASVTAVRAQVATLLAQPMAKTSVQLTTLARLKRAALSELRRRWNPAVLQGLDQLRLAPILIHADQRAGRQSLADVRQAERGVGDHPLTLFDTGESFVFDQSPIFFDSAAGATLADTLTREALSWAVYLHSLPPAQPGPPIKPLSFPFETADHHQITQAPQVALGISVETTAVRLRAMLTLRQLFKQRSDLLNLTVGDLLLLYRAIHAATYQLAPHLLARLTALAQERRIETAVKAAINDLTSPVSPATLIPLDAAGQAPRERIYPLVFAAPLEELDLLGLHGRTLDALTTYEQASSDRSMRYAEFDQLQRTYLATLAGFGELLTKAKEIAASGQSNLKLVANLPGPIQRLLEKIPNRYDVLSELVKGREWFDNLGVVPRASSLTRFQAAKDDNERQRLAWGAMTDASGTLYLSLRDFRPHVAALTAAGQKPLAVAITQHYLDSYAQGLNAYIRDLRRITLASRETRLDAPV